MTGPDPRELDGVLSLADAAARDFLERLPTDPVRRPDADEVADRFGGPLPEEGDGALVALKELVEGTDAAIRSAGPRFFHWVIGGTTPASLGADWLASAIDQNAGAWGASPLAVRLEVVATGWLRELFGLPADWGGVLVTGATMANFTGLACARRWWGRRHGVDVENEGLSGLPPVPVLTSGYVHSSARKALAMLGIGREAVRTFTRDAAGRLDLPAMEEALRDLDGAPAILIGNAGEVNAGDFDPIAEMADLAERYDAWLHVDGAFGLFAAVSPRTEHLVEGVDRAHSVIADGHKWLNVPHDCGFAFVRDPSLLGGVFTQLAAYLPPPDDPRPVFFNLGPESSRRARALAVWATLRAYGRSGYREVVERCLSLARHLAERVDASPVLERLAEVPLDIVCFRYRPDDRDDDALDDLNRRLGEALLEDGRVFAGTTLYEGRVAFRPAFVNWRTREEDVDLLVDVLEELGAELA